MVSQAVADYWMTSRNRFELWHQTLARYRRAEVSGDFHSLRQWWRDHLVVMEEVLVTEILTRVVAALASAVEAESGVDEISPITHAVHITHIEARNRVQKIMLYGRGNSIEDAVRLNRLRQAVERWTDAMIGRMSITSTRKLQYAFEPARAGNYCDDMRQLGTGASRKTAMWLMNASMHDMLSRRTSQHAALPEANRRVAQSLMMMLRPGLFDGVGTLKSIWLHQLESSSERSDRAVKFQQLLTESEEGVAATSQSHQPHFERWYQ
jgi:hypothetical protein